MKGRGDSLSNAKDGGSRKDSSEKGDQGLPVGVAPTIPEPFSLNPQTIAQLAAVLSLRHPAEKGNERGAAEFINPAINLYVRAHLRCRELAGQPIEEVIARLDDFSLALDFSVQREKTNMLRLYPDDAKPDEAERKRFFTGSLDQVRQYFYDHSGKTGYAGIKSTKHLLAAFKTMLEDQAARMGSSDGAAQYDQLIEHAAVRAYDAEGEIRHHQTIGEEPKPKGTLLYWQFDQQFLDKWLTWRIALKRSGGVRGAQNRLRTARAHAKQ